MKEFFTYLGIYGLGSTLIISVIGYLGMKVIEQILNKDLEKFKIQLTSENEKAKLHFEKEIESYRAGLNLIYSKQIQLYSKKTDIIETLYHKLVDFKDAMLNMTLAFRFITGKDEKTIDKEEAERVNNAANKGNEFFTHYSQNKIYFDIDTCRLIEDLQFQFHESHNDYSFKYNFGIGSKEMTYDMAKKASDRIRKEIPTLMEKLENDFRLTLGVIENKIKTATKDT